MPNGVRLIKIDCSKFCECKIALTFLRTPDFAFDGVPCTQAKFAYLIGRYINIIRASRSEEHTSELQSLMRISYAVFCLKKKRINTHEHHNKPKASLTIVSKHH